MDDDLQSALAMIERGIVPPLDFTIDLDDDEITDLKLSAQQSLNPDQLQTLLINLDEVEIAREEGRDPGEVPGYRQTTPHNHVVDLQTQVEPRPDGFTSDEWDSIQIQMSNNNVSAAGLSLAQQETLANYLETNDTGMELDYEEPPSY